MPRITNDVLAEKIDNLHSIMREIKPEIKSNSEFRHTAKGALGVLTFAAGLIGGAVVYSFGKLFGK